MSNVFVPNNMKHTATDAERFGEIVYLTRGPVNRMAVKSHTAAVNRALVDSAPDDFVVVGSLSVLTAIAVGCFMKRHGHANLLVWDNGEYRVRRVSG